jgi:hypothetical protein
MRFGLSPSPRPLEEIEEIYRGDSGTPVSCIAVCEQRHNWNKMRANAGKRCRQLLLNDGAQGTLNRPLERN